MRPTPLLLAPALAALLAFPATAAETTSTDSHTVIHDDDGTTNVQRHRVHTRDEGQTTTDSTTVIHGEDGTRTVKAHDERAVEREGDTTTWHREHQRRDSEGRSAEMVADGTRTRNDDGSVSTDIDRSGTRSNSEGDTVSWEEQVSAESQDNDLGGHDTTRERQRSTSRGREVSETTQRQSRDDGEDGRAFREATTRMVDGEERQLYREGRTTRRLLDDGYVETSRQAGTDDQGAAWQRERRETVRYLKNGQRWHQIITATTTGNGVRYRIEEGTYHPLGNDRGWNYQGKVEIRDGQRVTETRNVTRQLRRLPVPETMPTDE